MDRLYSNRKTVKVLVKLVFAASFLIVFTQCNKTKNSSAEEQAKALLSNMSLKEKAGQMTQLSIEMILQGKDQFTLDKPHQLDAEKLKKMVVDMGVGSILNVPGNTFTLKQWKEVNEALYQYSKQTKNQIPVLYGIDAIHGANYTVGATLYPQQINLAASFNTGLIEQMAMQTANDVRASGIAWNFSPVLDVARNPKWPRYWETFGEDPFIVATMGTSMVNAYQANTKNGLPGVAACLKHYVGYGDARSGMDRTPAYIPERQLREIHLLPFAKAIEAGAQTIMVNSGEVNGEPVHASSFLLKTILRDELKFKGITVTDWEDIKNLYERHKVAENYKEAVALAINAGIDMAMVPLDTLFTHYLIENAKEGKIPLARIDEAVLRILTLKYKLGLFDDKPENMEKYEPVGSEESQQLALELATQSLVLLKNNNNVLPISNADNILVTGPNADYLNSLNGGWTHTWQGRDTSYNPDMPTCVAALKKLVGNDKIAYLPGNTYEQNLPDNQLLAAAKNVNTVVLFLGEDTYTEKPGDISDLELSEAQQHLIKTYKLAGKKVVVVLLQGRPRTFAKTEPMCDAILYAGLPGNAGATAIANVLFGLANPSGKLPFTYPRHAGFHLTYDCKNTELYDKDFKLNGFNPLFEFGSGKSYTSFKYSNLTCDKKTYQITDTVKVVCTVSNTGLLDGFETTLLFSNDEVASITPSVKRLRAFEKQMIKKGESNVLTFALPVKDLAFVGVNNKWVVEPGVFTLSIDTLTETITVLP